MLAYARLEAITSSAPPLSGEARSLLAAQCFPSARIPAAPVAAVTAALGLPLRRTQTPAPEHRLPVRLLAPEPSTQELTLWKEYSAMGLHEIFSAEFLDELAAAVRSLLHDCAGKRHTGEGDQLPVVLEIGAGSGALAHQIGLRLRGQARVVASDDHSSHIETVIPVEPLNCSAALAAHTPAVVLISWMPSGVDWTAEVRACASTCAYVMIGESDGDNCGDSWSTWGILPEDAEDYGLDEQSVAPFRKDGWKRLDLESVSKHQICRFDSAVCRGFSCTVAFTRSTSFDAADAAAAAQAGRAARLKEQGRAAEADDAETMQNLKVGLLTRLKEAKEEIERLECEEQLELEPELADCA